MKSSRLYLIDAHGLLHRSHHALAGAPLSNSKGEPVGALYGFARTLLALLKKEKPDAVVVCFDAPGPTFRHKAYAEYKANRPETDADLKRQLPQARGLAEALGMKVFEKAGWEADDLLATFAAKATAEGWDAVLVTADKDAMQMVGPKVRVLDPGGASFDAAAVEAKYGLRPTQLVDYFALIGDAVDNIPGVPGVGPKTATKLLQEHGTLDRILELARTRPEALGTAGAKLKEHGTKANESRPLLKLATDVPVDLAPSDCRLQPPGDAAVQLLRELEFNSLVKDLFPQGLAVNGTLQKVAPSELLKRAEKAGKVAIAAAQPASDAVEGQGELPGAEAPAGLAASAAGVVSIGTAEQLKPILESKALKVGHDIKTFLRSAPVAGPIFDTAIAAWCLNPSKAAYGLADVLLDQLGQPFPVAPGGEGAARQAEALWPLFEKLEKALDASGLGALYRDVELPIMRVLSEMEKAGVAVDGDYLQKLGREFDAAITGMKLELDKAAGAPLNPNSPKQIAKLLFEDLKLPAGRKTKTGYSTDEETLKGLASLHPLPAKLLEYREWSKLKSTYIDALIAAAVRGRVHTTFLQSGSATGRLASVHPNLQNIPIRSPLGMKIRRAFVAEKGLVLVSADYSQIDLRLLAHESADAALIEAFKSGLDIHTRTAAEVFGRKLEDVSQDERRMAKAVNFGVVYGQSAHGLAATLGIPHYEAQKFIERYFARYSGVKAWIDAHLAQARKDGFVRTWLGRVRYLPELAAKNPNLRAFAERAAVNTTIQGGSADVMKKAMLAVAAGIGKASKRARMVLQVHDDLLFEVPEGEAKAFAAWAQDVMEHAAPLRVPLTVDVKLGTNWSEMKKL